MEASGETSILFFQVRVSVMCVSMYAQLEKKKKKRTYVCEKSESVSCLVVSDPVTPWTVPTSPPLSMEFSRQEYWRGLPYSTPGNLPDPGIRPTSLASPALVGRFSTTAPPGQLELYNREEQISLLDLLLLL